MRRDIILHCCKHFKVHPRDLLSKDKHKWLIPARFAAYKILHARGTSYTHTGKMLNRDHSTVMHGIKVAERWMQEDPAFKQFIDEMIALTPVKLQLDWPEDEVEGAE